MAALLRAEYEHLLASLSEKLDIAKARGLVHGSISIRLANTYDPVFLDFLGKGKTLIRESLREMAPPPGVAERDRLVCAAVKAAVVDDVNLARVFQVLRIEELLENCFEDLTITMSAAVVCAILGELKAVAEQLEADEEDDRLREFNRQTVCFIHATISTLTNFIIESGRDRFTYMKETTVSSASVPPRVVICRPPGTRLADINKALQCAANPYELNTLFAEELTYVPVTEAQQSGVPAFQSGDRVLELLLRFGSVLGIIGRLQRLYSRYWQQSEQLIKWSFCRQAPRLHRMRQLAVTEVMYALSRLLDSADKTSRARAALSQELLSMHKGILKTIVDGLLTSGLTAWCYEREEQRITISTKGVSGPSKQTAINDFLCIKLSRE
ncbi:hypothetical protein BESB_048350 [Besnoitia besnoiti]|uniref:Uncharacterized protein n=1 Tax=Besnoitia besnoiti TaxID=94643 RepID=A0A2A9MLP9_BESBE|nr:hypothetical protein BESB_048350 [Besnoitia besnoiti]PFH36643.1 hypothetical protein BESB_048350 [Besnoitia besnoiti]